jgi:GGDEF domain-containing protein
MCVYLCAIAIEHEQWRVEHQRRAYVDALTDLPNRASFNAALAQMTCDQPGAWGILVIDLDNLKVVNDTFGHHAGDCLLMVVAQRIETVLAPDRAYRLGGDEFAILIQETASLRDLDGAASKVLDALVPPSATAFWSSHSPSCSDCWPPGALPRRSRQESRPWPDPMPVPPGAAAPR